MTRVQRFLAPVGESELPPHGPMVPCLRALLQRNRGPTVLIMHSPILLLALGTASPPRLHAGPGIQNSQGSSATVSRSSQRERAPSSWRNGTVPSCPAIAEPRSHRAHRALAHPTLGTGNCFATPSRRPWHSELARL
jgi:hypothetical protein